MYEWEGEAVAIKKTVKTKMNAIISIADWRTAFSEGLIDSEGLMLVELIELMVVFIIGFFQ